MCARVDFNKSYAPRRPRLGDAGPHRLSGVHTVEVKTNPRQGGRWIGTADSTKTTERGGTTRNVSRALRGRVARFRLLGLVSRQNEAHDAQYKRARHDHTLRWDPALFQESGGGIAASRAEQSNRTKRTSPIDRCKQSARKAEGQLTSDWRRCPMTPILAYPPRERVAD